MQSSHILALLIVAIIFGTKVAGDYFRARAKEREVKRPAETDDMLRQIATLEERVRVLEQIVTDPRESLSRKISNL